MSYPPVSERPYTLLMSEDFYRSMLGARGIIHWLTLDRIAEPWRRFRAQQLAKPLRSKAKPL